MNDEIFHLTPVDVRRYEFGTTFRGFDPARVNQFRVQVADELERLARINQDLEAKARGFHEQLRAFRERDKALNEALISAQQMREDIKGQAEREAELIVREARAEGDRLIEAARVEVRKLERNADALERLRRSYVVQMRKMAEQQLAELQAAEHAPTPARPTPVDASEAIDAQDRDGGAN
ncbi:MAG: DivIVA domain-containing protein [Gemmatimonadetes bacterium]|nr:DivIVA domain-containing protein [Gemmatimonadota bacterium]